MIPWQDSIGFLNRTKNPSPPSFRDIMDNIAAGEYFTQEDQNIQVIKDMPVHLPPHVFDEVCARFPAARHIFLVRHPYHMIPSYFKAIANDSQAADYTEEVIHLDTTYKPLLDAAERVASSGQGSALMLDAETLIADPRSSLTKLCSHIGVPFAESLLRWKPNEVPSSWRDLDAFEGWLDTVVSSSGWVVRPQADKLTYPAVSDGIQKTCIDMNMPFYEQMMRMRA